MYEVRYDGSSQCWHRSVSEKVGAKLAQEDAELCSALSGNWNGGGGWLKDTGRRW